MLFLLFYIIIILASISVQIMAIANIGGRVGVIVGVYNTWPKVVQYWKIKSFKECHIHSFIIV